MPRKKKQQKKPEKTLYAIIRIKGRVNVNPKVKYTLELLRLHKKFNLVIYPKDLPGLEGMLQRAKDWITWGEIDKETLEQLLEKRGRIPGNKKITPEYLKEKYGVKTLRELVEKIFTGEIVLHKQEDIKPVFRLHPPKKGFDESIKRPFRDEGELGYRGQQINELIKRMI